MKLEEIVGINVARLREQRQLSQAELGERLGRYLDKPWSRQAVSAAEKGRRAFAVAELVALALTLDVEMSDLLGVLIRLPDQDVELPGAVIHVNDYNALVEPQNVDDAIKGVDLRTVKSLIPMLKQASWTTNMLYSSLRDLFLGDEAREADEREQAGNAEGLLQMLHGLRAEIQREVVKGEEGESDG